MFMVLCITNWGRCQLGWLISVPHGVVASLICMDSMGMAVLHMSFSRGLAWASGFFIWWQKYLQQAARKRRPHRQVLSELLPCIVFVFVSWAQKVTLSSTEAMWRGHHNGMNTEAWFTGGHAVTTYHSAIVGL